MSPRASQATVSAQITGTLTQVLIEEGEHVTKGRCSRGWMTPSTRRGLVQAQAQLRARRRLLAQYQAQLWSRRKRDLVRNQDLIGRHLVSQQAVETCAHAGRRC